MDGKNKLLNFRSSYLGATKQLPFLIKEVRKIMPYVEMTVFYSDCADLSRCEVLEKDLEREGLAGEISISKSKDFCWSPDSLEVSFGRQWTDHDRTFSRISFHIDSLKFEKRKLLDDGEVLEMKKKYFIESGNVVLWGSVNWGEEFETTANAVKKFPKTVQSIIVPRGGLKSMYKVLERQGVHFSTDECLDGRSDCLVITQNGILDRLYSICDTAIIGGGQNPLEPAFYGKRTLVPFRGSNNEVAYEGLENSGLLKRIDKGSIVDEVLKDVSPVIMNEYKEKAQNFIESQQGVAKKYAEVIQLSLYGKMDYYKWKELMVK
ncbi:hypothetical protein J4226_01480 [Candidatus Pacearchaeota archaeon]|nr:hypothetical protein [Candidatus Pacearchaeota archaeon]